MQYKCMQTPDFLPLEFHRIALILPDSPHLKREVMPEASTQRAESSETEPARPRPVATFKQGGVEVTIWRNTSPLADVYNTTIRNSYKEEKADEWKETANFSPSDLAILAQLSGQAFQEIVRLRKQNRTKPEEVAPR